MMIMASAAGTPAPAIARLTAADEDTVRDVIHAFNDKGLAALDAQWAGGRPRLISDKDIEVIVATATTRPEKLGLPFTHGPICAGVTPTPATPTSWPPSAANAPASAANASNAGAAQTQNRMIKPGERSWTPH